jgi:hypothetical protein
MLKKQECKYFKECNAPLCPLMKEDLEKCVWYPDEKICKVLSHQKLRWIVNQRKISKLGLSLELYFNFTMLNRKFRITKSLKGLNPECDTNEYPEALDKWLKRHPELKKREVKKESLDALKKATCNRSMKEKEGNVIDIERPNLHNDTIDISSNNILGIIVI